MKRYLPYLIVIALAIVPTSALAELRADQLALVVNRNVPESIELAQFYAQARGVPAGRIIELDLPNADQIPFELYEPAVVNPVRTFLKTNQLDRQVTCLVTFYGVPLRVAARSLSSEQQQELSEIRTELSRVQARLSSSIEHLEALAKRLDSGFRPGSNTSADALARRADHATRAINLSARAQPDAAKHQQALAELARLSQPLTNPIGDAPTTTASTAPAATQPLDRTQYAPLLAHQNDPAAREQLRTIACRSGSPFAYERLLQEQYLLLEPQHSDSAIDSELSLLWAEGYSRTGWQPNPLGYPYVGNPTSGHVVMVARLDAPTPQLVRNIIADSVTIEREGLKGKFVIDSRGIPARKPGGAEDAFGAFDERLRDLAALVKTSTRLELVHDDAPDVLAANSVVDVALYCGWYSVGKYVPAMKFVRGALAYHIASYELTSLRDPTNTGWCRGLLIDGVTVTLGPVAEPLLHAFPVPDDFFPLLLTGKLTLAEVYWRTVPMTSWKLTLIGDPLYTPFKSNPALAVEQLPARLRVLFSDAAAAEK